MQSTNTVFCVSVSTIQRRVEKLRKTFSVGRMRYGETGKEESRAVKEYKELFTKQNDVYAEGSELRKKLEKEWGVSMSEME